MGFFSDFGYSIKIGSIFFAILIIVLIPWSNFITLPDFLWFLDNKSVLGYFNEYLPQFITMIPFFGLLLLFLIIVGRKRK